MYVCNVTKLERRRRPRLLQGRFTQSNNQCRQWNREKLITGLNNWVKKLNVVSGPQRGRVERLCLIPKIFRRVPCFVGVQVVAKWFEKTCLGWWEFTSTDMSERRRIRRAERRGDKPSCRRRPTAALRRAISRGEPGQDTEPDATFDVWSSATRVRSLRPRTGDLKRGSVSLRRTQSVVVSPSPDAVCFPTTVGDGAAQRQLRALPSVSEHQSPSSKPVLAASVDDSRPAFRRRQSIASSPSGPGQYRDVVIIGHQSSVASPASSSAIESSLSTRRYNSGRWWSRSHARWTRSSMTSVSADERTPVRTAIDYSQQSSRT